MSSAARSTRALLRSSARPVRSAVPRRQFPAQARFNSQQANAAPAGNGIPHAVTGGLVGGGAVLLALYGYYHLSGAKAIVDQASSVKNYLKSSADQLAKQTPEPSEALDALKSFATSYAAFIPGGRAFVDSSFKDLETVRAKHGDKVDKIVKDTYTQMQALVKKDGLSLDGAAKAYDILTTQMKAIGDLAADAAGDIIDRHPEIKEKLGGSVEQLKTYADKYGPEAKKKVDETWSQVSEVLRNGKGLSKDNIDKVRQIVQDAAASVEQFSNEAFKKGIEQAQPLLDKAPQVKELINKNMNDLVKKADWQELYQKIQESVKSGKTQPVEEYVKKVLEATKDK